MSSNCDHSVDHAAVNRTIGQLAQWMEAVSFPENLAERDIPPIWMDSRKIENGDIFLALAGDDRDGHDFVEQTLAAGASAAIVAEDKVKTIPKSCRDSLIVVKDPLGAVQKAANAYRLALAMPIIAITGSNGKTTSAQFLRTLLSTEFEVGGTRGNWNNHIGVPLSILRLTGEEEVAIFEIGANHVGEIATLAEIIEPDMGIITNVGYAHVGYFGGIEKTAQAKFELARQIKKVDGVLFLNGDDEMSIKQNEIEQVPALYFGMDEQCEIHGENLVCRPDGCYDFDFDGTAFTLSTPGYHIVSTVLPLLVICMQMGISREALVEEVSKLTPADMRGGIEEINNVRYIVDCYNANPSSMKVAGQLLKDIPDARRRIAVLGDMKELGNYEEDLHKEIGAYFAELGIDMLFAVGERAETYVGGAIRAGLSPSNCYTAENAKAAIAPLKELLKDNDLVLLKGSRGVALEQILEGMQL